MFLLIATEFWGEWDGFRSLKRLREVEVERVTWEDAAEVEWDLIRLGFKDQGEDFGLSPKCSGSKGGFQQGLMWSDPRRAAPQRGGGGSLLGIYTFA